MGHRHTEVVTIVCFALFFCCPSCINGCNDTFTSLQGSFLSPNFPANYSNNMRCSYLITVPAGHRITVTFHVFDLQSPINSVCQDVVKIYDGGSASSPKLRTLCGSEWTLDTRTTQNQMYILFTSDGSLTFQGFNASYSTDTKGDNFVLFAESTFNRLRRVDLQTITDFTIPTIVVHPTAVDYDLVNQRVFFLQQGDPSIHSVFFNGTDRRRVIQLDQNAVLKDIAVDPASQLIFYTDDGNDVISVVTTSGSSHKRLFSSDFKPQLNELALDTERGYVFWMDGNNIERANYDGTDRKTVLQLDMNQSSLLSITLDVTQGRLYWLHSSVIGTSPIEYSDLNGDSRREMVSIPHKLVEPLQIRFQDDKIYFFIDKTNGSRILYLLYWIQESDLTAYFILGTPYILDDMVVYKQSTRRSTPCQIFNGCSHMCIPSPDNSIRCMCPDGLRLSSNGITCVADKNEGNKMLIIGVSVGALVIVIAVVFIITVIWKRRDQRSVPESRRSEDTRQIPMAENRTSEINDNVYEQLSVPCDDVMPISRVGSSPAHTHVKSPDSDELPPIPCKRAVVRDDQRSVPESRRSEDTRQIPMAENRTSEINDNVYEQPSVPCDDVMPISRVGSSPAHTHVKSPDSDELPPISCKRVAVRDDQYLHPI